MIDLAVILLLYNTSLSIKKHLQKMPTCNWVDLETL